MEKPSKVEVGQRWQERDFGAEAYTVTAYENGRFTLSWEDGIAGNGFTEASILEDNFVGWVDGYGPTPEPPRDEERCPCEKPWSPPLPEQVNWLCLFPTKATCGPVVVACMSCGHARCAEHAPKAFRAGPALSPEAIAKGKDAIRRLTEKTTTALKPSPAPAPVVEAPKAKVCVYLGAQCGRDVVTLSGHCEAHAVKWDRFVAKEMLIDKAAAEPPTPPTFRPFRESNSFLTGGVFSTRIPKPQVEPKPFVPFCDDAWGPV